MVSLLQDGGLDLKQARLWGPYITDGGDVVSGHCIAKIRGETQIWACAFLIDASMPRARVLNVSEYPANSIDPRLLHNLQWK